MIRSGPLTVLQDDAIRHDQMDVVQLLVKYKGRPSSDEAPGRRKLGAARSGSPKLYVVVFFWGGRLSMKQNLEGSLCAPDVSQVTLQLRAKDTCLDFQANLQEKL